MQQNRSTVTVKGREIESKEAKEERQSWGEKGSSSAVKGKVSYEETEEE